MSPHVHMASNELLERLELLRAERVLARATALAGDALYMSDLNRELAETRRAYVAAVVAEAAALRARSHGILSG